MSSPSSPLCHPYRPLSLFWKIGVLVPSPLFLQLPHLNLLYLFLFPHCDRNPPIWCRQPKKTTHPSCNDKENSILQYSTFISLLNIFYSTSFFLITTYLSFYMKIIFFYNKMKNIYIPIHSVTRQSHWPCLHYLIKHKLLWTQYFFFDTFYFFPQ